MKKLALMLAVVFLAAVTYGQTTTTTKKVSGKATTKTEQVKTTSKNQAVTTDKSLTVSKTALDSTNAKLKKVGTPDKRYKENKTAKTTGPLKKDGTPDLRYKSNKTAASTTTTATKK
jgi:transposase-like protein